MNGSNRVVTAAVGERDLLVSVVSSLSAVSEGSRKNEMPLSELPEGEYNLMTLGDSDNSVFIGGLSKEDVESELRKRIDYEKALVAPTRDERGGYR